MDGAQHRAVAGFLAEFGDFFVEFLFIHFAQNFLAKEPRDLFHFCWNRRVFVRQVGMIRTGVDGAKRIARVCEVVIDLLHDRHFRVVEVDEHQTADARRHLIHEARRLAVIDVLRILSDLRDLNGRYFAVCKQTVQDSANQHLKRCRAGKPGTGQHRGLDLRVKARELVPALLERRRHAANQCRSRILFGFFDREVVQADLDGLVALRIHTDDVRAVEGHLRRRLHIDRRRDHAPMLMVGVVAADLRAPRRGKMIRFIHSEPPSGTF